MNRKTKIGLAIFILAIGLALVSITGYTVKYTKQIETLNNIIKTKSEKIAYLEKTISNLEEEEETTVHGNADGSFDLKKTKKKKQTTDSSKSTASTTESKEIDKSKREEREEVSLTKPITLGIGVLIKPFNLQDRLYYLHISKPFIGNLGLEAQIQSNFTSNTYLGVGLTYNL